MITARELEAICEALLVEGVPPGVVARVFHLDGDLVKKLQTKLRIKRYGTEDLSEYLEQIQWDTLDELRTIIARGSAADKVKFAGMLIGKQMAVAARRTPEKTREATDRVLEILENMRTGEGRTENARSGFVVNPGNPDDQDEDREAAQAQSQ